MREKRDLHEIVLEIVRLLVNDAQRPFSDIPNRVGLYTPAVWDRVERLQEQGIIRQFPGDIDRLKLQNCAPVVGELGVGVEICNYDTTSRITIQLTNTA